MCLSLLKVGDECVYCYSGKLLHVLSVVWWSWGCTLFFFFSFFFFFFFFFLQILSIECILFFFFFLFLLFFGGGGGRMGVVRGGGIFCTVHCTSDWAWDIMCYSNVQ